MDASSHPDHRAKADASRHLDHAGTWKDRLFGIVRNCQSVVSSFNVTVKCTVYNYATVWEIGSVLYNVSFIVMYTAYSLLGTECSLLIPYIRVLVQYLYNCLSIVLLHLFSQFKTMP